MQVPAGLPAVESPRHARRLAVNDAVDAYRRESGTRDYQAAFTHILRTRQDLFAGMQDPSGVVAAANFNPYHDPLGRFTTSDEAVAPHGCEHLPAHHPHLPELDMHSRRERHREHDARPAQRQEGKETPAPAAIPSIRDDAISSPTKIDLRNAIIFAKRP